MKISCTLDFSSQERRAIADHCGGDGMASRDELLSWARATLSASLESIVDEYERGKLEEAIETHEAQWTPGLEDD